jgi:hypothetical protein
MLPHVLKLLLEAPLPWCDYYLWDVIVNRAVRMQGDTCACSFQTLCGVDSIVANSHQHTCSQPP